MALPGLLFISGFGIAIVGICYAVTGSILLGIAVTGIGAVVISVTYGAEVVSAAVLSSRRNPSDIEALEKSMHSFQEALEKSMHSFQDVVHEINESLRSKISRRVDKETNYIVAAILTAAARDHDRENSNAPPITAGAPPPYVTASVTERRACIASEVLQQLLAGRTRAQALEYAADKFRLPETVISDSWNSGRISACDLLIEELIRKDWELTDEARTRFGEICSLRELKRVRKKQGRLGEVVTAIREDFIRERFQRRVERGVVLSDERKEAKALLDELREGFQRREKFQGIKTEMIKLPRIKTIMKVIEDPYREHWLTEYRLNQIGMRNFASVLKLYRDILQKLRFHHDDLFKDHPWC
jgi:hypothetical protein